jgi:4'-phosphopantetheinyl transferase
MPLSVPALRDDVCQVWWAGRGLYRPGLVDLLDAVERRRLAALVRPADRERFVLGCALLRTVLGAHLSVPPRDVPLERSCRDCGQPHGKVRTGIGDPPVQMSLSHSGDRVAAAFHPRAQVGVDVEYVDPRLDTTSLAGHTLSESEAAAFALTEPHSRAVAFTTYWVRKEAVVKATGAGLRAPLTAVVVSPPGTVPRLLAAPGGLGPGRDLQLYDLDPGPGHAAALAVLGKRPVDVREFDAREVLAG